MKKNQKGFSAVEVIVVIVIVGLLGAVGWLVYDRQKSTSVNSSSSDASANPAQPTIQPKTVTSKPVDPYSGWKVETNEKYKFTYKYPVTDSKYTWTSFVTENPSSSQLYKLGEYINAAGVNLGTGGRAGYQPFAFKVTKVGSTEDQSTRQWEQNVDGNYYKKKSQTTVTKNGLTGTKWEYQSLNDSNSDFIRYQFTKDGMNYHIIIEGKASGIDVIKYGEQIYSTFNFL